VQRSCTCRHGGNASQMCCPNCMAHSDERLAFTHPYNVDLQRTTPMVDAIVNGVSGGVAGKTVKKKALQLLGVSTTRSERGLFRGVYGDPVVQSPTDPEHLWCYGIFKSHIKLGVAQMKQPDRVLLGKMAQSSSGQAG
jgi:hypothetical protein